MNLSTRHKTAILIAGALIATFISFSPCLKNGYCNWDDYHLITANHSIKDLSWKNIKEFFTTGYIGTYIPLTVFSFALEYKFFKLNPFVTHAINLILHLLNVILVFWFIYLLSNNLMLSFFVSLLFGIHPLHVESVAWATERKDVLYTFFYLGSLIFYLDYRRHQRNFYYILSIIFFLFSVFSKPMAVTLPVILVLVDIYYENKFSINQLFPKVPYFLFALFFGIINIHFQGSGEVPFVNYLKHLFIFCYNLLFYFYKLILPVNLSAFYPYPENFPKSMPIIFIIAPFFVAVIIYLIIKTKKVSSEIAFGILFFIITILPVSQIIPLIAPAIAADRYVYVPSIGFFYSAGVLINWLYHSRFKKFSVQQAVFITLLIGIFIIFGIISFNRCMVWKDSITLWTDVLKKFPENGIAYNNRGNAYKLIGEYNKALEDFNKAIEYAPQLELPYFNRGVVYERLGQYEKALADFTTALSLQPDFPLGYVDRGAIYCKIGQYDKAYNDLIRALQLNPYLAEAYYNLGVLYFNLRNYNLALENYNKAIGIDPYLSVVYVSKGDIYFLYRDYARAIENYTRAIEIDTLNVDAYYNRAVTFTRVENLEQALYDYNRVLRLKPNFVYAYNNRGNIYMDFGEIEKAIQDYNKAIELDSGYAPAYYNRAVAYYTSGDIEAAKRDVSILKKIGIIPDSNLLKILKE